MADHDVDACGNQLGCDVGGDLGLALVVDYHKFNLLAVDAAGGVDFGDDHFGGVLARQAVRGDVAGVRTSDAELDDVSGGGRQRERRRNECGGSEFDECRLMH